MSELPTLKQRFLRSKRRERTMVTMLGLGAFAFASAVLLYVILVELPKQREFRDQAYQDLTQQLSKRIETGVANLSEWSTDESLESYSKAISILDERKDADRFLNAALNERVDALKEARRTRQIRFESLMKDVDKFPLVSSVDAVLSFDRRMQNATYTLSRKQGDDLMDKWSDRRSRVVAIAEANH